MKELLIETIAYGGDGIARLDGRVIFVPGVLPGETVLAAEESVKPNYSRARLAQVLQASPDRIPPACPLALRPLPHRSATSPFCPGCAYQHMAYPVETSIKLRQAHEFLARLAATPALPWTDPVAAPAPLGYRNKLVLHAAIEANQAELGYVQADNQTVLDIPACALATASLNDMLGELRAKPGFFKTLRQGMDVTFRHTLHDGTVWWRGNADPAAPWLTESSGIGPLRVPRGSFFQVNPAVADRLVGHVGDIVGKSRCSAVLDLYCGVGVFALHAARAGKQAIIGIEEDSGAIDAANHNARELVPDAGKRLRWRCGDAAALLPLALGGLAMRETLVIVDPPRTGLDARLMARILAARPAELIYVACAPDRQARDLARLRTAGYAVKSAALFDMFPRTPHFEVVIYAMIED